MDKVILENPRPVNIYALSDPETGAIRYVGKTMRTLKRRLGDHIYFSKEGRCYSSHWVKSLVRKGVIPVITLIEVCNENNWKEREKFWINEMRKTCKLTNTLDGEFSNFSEEQKQELHARRMNRYKSISKPVCQYDWQGKFVKKWTSPSEAGKALDIDISAVRKACSNPSAFVGGHYWRFFKDTGGEDIKVVLSKEFKNVTKMNESYEILQHFRTLREAGKSVGVGHGAIMYAIKKNTCLRGFRWAYTAHEQTS